MKDGEDIKNKRPWALNGISWVYNDTLDIPCPNCKKKELTGSPFTYPTYRCESCLKEYSENWLYENFKK